MGLCRVGLLRGSRAATQKSAAPFLYTRSDTRAPVQAICCRSQTLPAASWVERSKEDRHMYRFIYIYVHVNVNIYIYLYMSVHILHMYIYICIMHIYIHTYGSESFLNSHDYTGRRPSSNQEHVLTINLNWQLSCVNSTTFPKPPSHAKAHHTRRPGSLTMVSMGWSRLGAGSLNQFGPTSRR